MADQITISAMTTAEQFNRARWGVPWELAAGRALSGARAEQLAKSSAVLEPELLVRPFESFRERRDQRLEQLRTPPGAAEETATLCWGKAPPLQQSTTNPEQFSDSTDQFSSGFNTRRADEEPAPSDEENTFTFQEAERKTKKIKVAAQDDPDVYVMVERIEQWIADGSDGRRYRFVFRNK